MAVSPIPAGNHTVTPYLIIRGAAAALDFYRRAFGAQEVMRLAAPGGQIGHAEIQIGDSRIMLADECPETPSPQALGGSPISILLYVNDVDAVFQRAIDAGATVKRPVQDQFYGDRSGMLTDPFGHTWSVATHQEDVPLEEIERRFAAFAKPAKD